MPFTETSSHLSGPPSSRGSSEHLPSYVATTAHNATTATTATATTTTLLAMSDIGLVAADSTRRAGVPQEWKFTSRRVLRSSSGKSSGQQPIDRVPSGQQLNEAYSLSQEVKAAPVQQGELLGCSMTACSTTCSLMCAA